MNNKFTRNFQGGPSAYLERWEKASIAYEKLSKDGFGMDNDTKRSTFIQMFTIQDVTETTVDLAAQSTDTFEELMFAIKTRLARKLIFIAETVPCMLTIFVHIIQT